uniref:Uncharacterized protein n=1 Tax=Strombidium inclinatum TaxID=197538 RepID=A0A7S3IJ72_9SPIT
MGIEHDLGPLLVANFFFGLFLFFLVGDPFGNEVFHSRRLRDEGTLEGALGLVFLQQSGLLLEQAQALRAFKVVLLVNPLDPFLVLVPLLQLGLSARVVEGRLLRSTLTLVSGDIEEVSWVGSLLGSLLLLTATALHQVGFLLAGHYVDQLWSTLVRLFVLAPGLVSLVDLQLERLLLVLERDVLRVRRFRRVLG